ncbi:MAG TPA: TetR/AcrR family transcriptional regulator [Gemmatimonadaceae bacterium]
MTRQRPAATATAAITAPHPRRPRAATQQKLDELLVRSAKLIAEKGFEAMSMRDVSAAAGGSLAGLYHYFDSKEELLYQLQYRTFRSLLEGQEAIAAQPGSPEERFRRLLIGHLTFFAERTSEHQACTFELKSLSGERYETVETLRRRYYRLMTSVVAELRDGAGARKAESKEARHATLFIFGMLNWVFMWYTPERYGSVEELGEEMLDLVLNGLRGPKENPGARGAGT